MARLFARWWTITPPGKILGSPVDLVNWKLQRKEFVLYIGESDVLAGVQERSRFKEVAGAQALLPHDPLRA